MMGIKGRNIGLLPGWRVGEGGGVVLGVVFRDDGGDGDEKYVGRLPLLSE